jgi:hypothetical protein
MIEKGFICETQGQWKDADVLTLRVFTVVKPE